jgi:hypothetical protein
MTKIPIIPEGLQIVIGGTDCHSSLTDSYLCCYIATAVNMVLEPLAIILKH